MASNHPALAANRVAVITGAASGIGLAASTKFAALGMKVCMADLGGAALEAAAAKVRAAAGGPDHVRSFAVDVSSLDDVMRLKASVYDAFGEVAILMNNAGTGGGGDLFGDPARWRRILDVNLWGVINGVQAFAPDMIKQGTAAAIVNTGSKQGITCPPGDTAYNVSKAGVKVVTEALAHELRNTEGCRVGAHLLIPGFVFTAMTKGSRTVKPAAAWTPEQVIDFMLASLGKGDFYILCPDNDVPREMDERRILWAAGDIVENRPPLSRWHPDYREAFATFAKA
ncbi:MAG TPA: SDR family NAD(P)-dependent oxidoreductase [Roseiarcus sp.]|jgi:NAD(P)-dependent dehydrogenase (short-subunit alcohol dehydrogenase family)